MSSYNLKVTSNGVLGQIKAVALQGGEEGLLVDPRVLLDMVMCWMDIHGLDHDSFLDHPPDAYSSRAAPSQGRNIHAA